MNIINELKKHFYPDGIHRIKLTKLKSLRKEYPNSPLLEASICAMRKKLWLFPGEKFLSEFIYSYALEKKIDKNGFLNINGIKVNLQDPASKWFFPFDYSDLFSSDKYFCNNYSQEPLLDKIIAIMFAGEGPYQHGNVALNDGDTVIDAGSHIGLFALCAAKYKKCNVYAFEPNPDIIPLLKENIEENNLGKEISIIPFGLSDAACDVEFNISLQNVRASTIVEDKKDKKLKWEKDTTSVHCVSLDDWAKENKITKIDFIKADIEGAERLLLQGAENVLKTMQPKLSICTYHLPDDPQVLEEIILNANLNYIVEQGDKKLYAYVR
jgi:FkbM family methyltransferase